MRYVERLTYDELAGELYDGQLAADLIVPDLLTAIDDLIAVPEESLDMSGGPGWI